MWVNVHHILRKQVVYGHIFRGFQFILQTSTMSSSMSNGDVVDPVPDPGVFFDGTKRFSAPLP